MGAQIRFHNLRACINVSQLLSAIWSPGPEEDMRNGVIGHCEAPVMMNHSSNVGKRKMCELRAGKPEQASFNIIWGPEAVRRMKSCEM